MERESEAGGRLGDLDSYEIEGGETKAEILQNLAEFQFSCVGYFSPYGLSLIFILSLFTLLKFSAMYCNNLYLVRDQSPLALLFLAQVLFNAVLENACSELGARMSAMDSSSRNAGEMLDRLTLTYNRSFSLCLSPCCVHSSLLSDIKSETSLLVTFVKDPPSIDHYRAN